VQPDDDAGLLWAAIARLAGHIVGLTLLWSYEDELDY